MKQNRNRCNKLIAPLHLQLLGLTRVYAATDPGWTAEGFKRRGSYLTHPIIVTPRSGCLDWLSCKDRMDSRYYSGHIPLVLQLFWNYMLDQCYILSKLGQCCDLRALLSNIQAPGAAKRATNHVVKTLKIRGYLTFSLVTKARTGDSPYWITRSKCGKHQRALARLRTDHGEARAP